MAVIADSSLGGNDGRPFMPGSGSATFFVVDKVDDVAVRTAVEATRRSSFGMGRQMRVVAVERPVRAGRVKLRLTGTVEFAAPIESIFRGAGAPHAQGEQEVELRAGVRYRVTGVLDSYRSEVWLEEEATHALVGRKIVTPVDPKRAAEMAAADHFICCNLRYEDGWITDSQPIGADRFIPAGARVKIDGWGKNQVDVSIEGRKFSIGPYNGYFRGSREDYAALMLVKADPTQRLASWSTNVQNAVVAGRIKTGMTREQVLMAIGYPRMDRTADLSGSNWVYFASADADEFDLDWNADGSLREINAASSVRVRVVAEP